MALSGASVVMVMMTVVMVISVVVIATTRDVTVTQVFHVISSCCTNLVVFI